MKKEKIVFTGKTEKESAELIEIYEALCKAPEKFDPEGVNVMVILGGSSDDYPSINENGMQPKEIFCICVYLAMHYPDEFTYSIESLAELSNQGKLHRTIH